MEEKKQFALKKNLITLKQTLSCHFWPDIFG